MTDEDSLFDYIIYHKNCFDGYTGFFLFMKTKKWKSKPIVYPDVPSATEIPPNIKGKNIIIIDVAYSAKIIKEIASLANKVLFIDHHVSIRDDVSNLNLKIPNEVVYDESYSGASLVWKHFFGDRESMPTFVKYIEDNDIGKWEFEETLPFISALEVNFKLIPVFDNLKEWDKLLDEDYLKEFVEKGRIYNEYKEYLIKRSSKKYSIMNFPSKFIVNMKKKNLNKINQYKVAVVNDSCPSVSLLGKRIVETADVDFCMIWSYHLDKKKYVVSMRSNKTDIGSIAKSFGGGGHKFAASFSFSTDEFNINDLFS